MERVRYVELVAVLQHLANLTIRMLEVEFVTETSLVNTIQPVQTHLPITQLSYVSAQLSKFLFV
jgi:hypothetical protein